jgi:murein DD-endopeptidase MepM/ murein hydrolase activator NlpD
MAVEGVSGLAVAAMAGGAMLIWSGVTGRRVTDVLRSAASGKAPPGPDPSQAISPAFDASSGAPSTGTPNAQGLVNPIGKGLTPGRIDEGVDFGGAGPLYAIGPGTIREVSGSGWPGGIFILLALDDGRFVYYAENITPMVVTGQKVKAGQQIGHANGSYPFIEIGWGTGQPQAASAAGHYTEGVPTAEGQSMRALLTQLGAP